MKKRWIIIGLVLIILFCWWFFQRPSVGVVNSKRVGPTGVPLTTWLDYQGRMFGFSYPPTLQIQSSDDAKVFLVGTVGLSQQLVVMAKNYSDSLDELADIKMRTIKNSLYSPFAIGEWRCFQKKESWERVCWRQNSGIVISVAMTANSNDPELEKDFERMVKSLRFI